MTTNQDVKPQRRPRRSRTRWILRILAIVIGIIALVDLIITVIPRPSPPRPSVLPGGIVTWSSYSETDVSIIKAKNRVESYLNPVGWVARFKGFGSDRLYILKRNESWKNALEVGQVLTLLVLLVVPFALWIVSVFVGKRSARDREPGGGES